MEESDCLLKGCTNKTSQRIGPTSKAFTYLYCDASIIDSKMVSSGGIIFKLKGSTPVKCLFVKSLFRMFCKWDLHLIYVGNHMSPGKSKIQAKEKCQAFKAWENLGSMRKSLKIMEKFPVFFSSNLLLCAMRLSGINGCETIVVKCYTLSAQPGAPDNYKRKRERRKKYRNDKNKLCPKRSWSCILWMALFL